MTTVRALAVIAMLAGCTNDSYLVVTVTARPAVHDAKSLVVTLANSGSTISRTLALGTHAFPLKFSVDAPGRSGQLDLSAEADDATGTAVGSGSATATIGAKSVALLLDSTDFVVNTDYAGDQFLSESFETDGVQVGADIAGTWTVGFRDSCNNTSSCNVFGRRFDPRGVAVSTAAAAGTNAFPLTTSLTDQFTYPAVAAASPATSTAPNGTGTIAVWNATDTVVTTNHSVGCRAISATGDASAGQLSLATDNANAVSLAPLSNGNFAVTWYVVSPANAVRTIIAKPDCTTLTPNPTTVSTVAGTLMQSTHVAANQQSVMYAWVVDGDVHIRASNNSAQFPAGDITAMTHTTSYEARSVRVVALGAAFGLVVRWASPSFMGPGKIELFQLSVDGTLNPVPLLITDQSQSDYTSGSQAPSAASRMDGAVLVAWHACDSAGSTGSCRVYGRMVRPNATPSGAAFVLSTITTGDQTAPAVAALPDLSFAAAWNDTSHLLQDPSGVAVHGRILYPAYDPNGTM